VARGYEPQEYSHLLLHAAWIGSLQRRDFGGKVHHLRAVTKTNNKDGLFKVGKISFRTTTQEGALLHMIMNFMLTCSY
jgi:hypothetical protein